jgi:hypothetical protein
VLGLDCLSRQTAETAAEGFVGVLLTKLLHSVRFKP